MDATCAHEPRDMVGDGQDTEQLFGADVDISNGTAAGKHTVHITAADLGYPVANLTDVPAGRYCLQAVFAPYKRYHRADGHVVGGVDAGLGPVLAQRALAPRVRAP